EFAGIFHGLGAHVTVVHRGKIFLRGFDDDLRVALAEEMGKRGIDLRFETLVSGIERTAAGVYVTLDRAAAVDANLIMFATGRAPNTHGIGLEDLGVMLDGVSAIVVDRYSRTSVENIYA